MNLTEPERRLPLCSCEDIGASWEKVRNGSEKLARASSVNVAVDQTTYKLIFIPSSAALQAFLIPIKVCSETGNVSSLHLVMELVYCLWTDKRTT